jgi:hypothetical protein
MLVHSESGPTYRPTCRPTFQVGKREARGEVLLECLSTRRVDRQGRLLEFFGIVVSGEIC